jgi:hypothetical protein
MPGHACDRDEGRRRLWELVEVLTLTLSVAETKAHAMKHFGLSRRSARRYVAAAVKIIQADARRSAPSKRVTLVRRLTKLAESAEASKNHGAAVQAMKLVATIEDMMPAQKVEHSGAVDLGHVSDDELAARAAEILARRKG